jgi:shikimate dehydrogenase
MDEPELNRFAVIGNPVAHSLSPYIHQSFAGQFDLSLCYNKILVDKGGFQSTLQQFFAEGGRGLNITTPFKSIAADTLKNCSATAQKCHSVNTILIDDSGDLRGESTDGEGWLADVRRLKIMLQGKNVLVIGAGGAASIIVDVLQDDELQALHICNRTEQSTDQFLQLNNDKVTASGLNNIPSLEWDLVINTLPVGWGGDYPSLNVSVTDTTYAYDLNYGRGAQAFLRWFFNQGGKQNQFSDGWGMLVEQAAGSFYHWWNRKPSTAQLIAAGSPDSSI